ncbi:MAG: diphthine--ammonia ligase [Bacteroidota bacterium]
MKADSKKPIIFSWSGGKDSALALYRLQQSGQYDIRALVTTVNSKYGRVSAHGVREELMTAQASAIGLPLSIVYLSEGSMEEYNDCLRAHFQQFKDAGIETVAYGDIFLEDLKTYRDDFLAELGMEGVYPLWKEDTGELIAEFMTAGFRTYICCVNDAWFDASHVGIPLDEAFLAALPENVDVCGENGEFHSFCVGGPIFKQPVSIQIGEKVYKPLNLGPNADPDTYGPTKGFWFCDLLMVEGEN